MARTKPLQENYAKFNVERQGHEAYLPRCIDPKAKRLSPLFPGYLFVYIRDRWVWLRSTYGVLDVILGNGPEPARLPDKIIAQIKARENVKGIVELPTDRFAMGTPVRITRGVFESRVGFYAGQSGRERVNVLLDMLGGQRSVQLDERFLELV